MSHDVNRQLSFIRQALAQNQRPTGFFLGAGCPLSIKIPSATIPTKDGPPTLEPLIWDVAGLTKIIAGRLSKKGSDWDKIIKLCEQDEGDSKNIEYILSRIRQFKMVAGKGEVRGLKETDLDKLDREICSIISELVNRNIPDKTSPYHNLSIWIRSIKREHPVHVFTTNYDLLMEQAFEETSTPYFDGFVGSRKAFFDLGAVEDENFLPPRWARLWKIHGSLNWRLEEEKRVVRSEEIKKNQSYLIYPSHLKYDQSRKMPYIAMLDRLKDFILKQHSIMFMSGYSFGDEHINDVICRALEANPTSHVYAFLFGDLEEEKYSMARECALASPNLNVMGLTGGIIGRNKDTWNDATEESTIDTEKGLLSGLPHKAYQFHLGDFAVFGNLVRNLTGE